MTRLALLSALAFAVLLPASATAQPDTPAARFVTVSVDKGNLIWNETVTVPVNKTVVVTVEIDGKPVEQTRAVVAYETAQMPRSAGLKDVKVTDGAGKAVDADKLTERLLKPTAVVVVSAPLPEAHRALFKDTTLFIELLPVPKDPKKGKK